MTVTLTRPVLSGSVPAIASKSHIHRLIIAAALYGSDTFVKYSGDLSDDISATVSCMRALGAEINVQEDEIHITGMKNACEASPSDAVKLYCGESGSTLRFLLPVVCALGISAEFYPEGRLPNRPLSPLREELIRLGCSISEQGEVPLKVRGDLNSGTANCCAAEGCAFEIDGGVSSQYITGLLLALPLLGGENTIRVTGRLESRPYVDMTIDVLSYFGIDITEKDSVFTVCTSSERVKCSDKIFYADGDWSNAAFWLCAGTIGKEPVCVSGLSAASKQGDREVLSLLERFGASISKNMHEDGRMDVTVYPSEMSGIEIDASDIPDLVPILACTAAAAKGRTVIYGAARLRLKESDRLRAVTDILGGLGADITSTDDGLIINGGLSYDGYPLKGGEADSYNDHRIAMTAAIASLISKESVIITGAQAVNKSYPRFFSDFDKLNLVK